MTSVTPSLSMVLDTTLREHCVEHHGHERNGTGVRPGSARARSSFQQARSTDSVIQSPRQLKLSALMGASISLRLSYCNHQKHQRHYQKHRPNILTDTSFQLTVAEYFRDEEGQDGKLSAMKCAIFANYSSVALH